MTFIHPKDDALVFPFVKYELDTPEKMMELLFQEYIEGRQSFDKTKNILYRKYEDNFKIDSISCHFTEDIRVQCVTGRYPTMVQIWKSMEPGKIKSFKSIDEIRKYILYTMKAKECNFFNPALCMRLYLGYNNSRKPLKILDPSAGWGDRMITAIACGDLVYEYHGYDTNMKLEPYYNSIINRLDISKKCKVTMQPFEKSRIEEKYYDLAVTSPPYFNLELYSTDIEQSYNNKTLTYDRWKNIFYIPYLKNMIKGVRVGGKIILYVSDYRDIDKNIIPLARDTVSLLDKLNTKLVIKGGYIAKAKRESSNAVVRPYFVFEVL